jgi:pimeloyl-ACP methyl ester carboxylesterase
MQKVDVLGYSRGSFIAQQLTVAHPEKVNRLMLVAASCGGKEGIPRSLPNLISGKPCEVYKQIDIIDLHKYLKEKYQEHTGSCYLSYFEKYAHLALYSLTLSPPDVSYSLTGSFGALVSIFLMNFQPSPIIAT